MCRTCSGRALSVSGRVSGEVYQGFWKGTQVAMKTILQVAVFVIVSMLSPLDVISDRRTGHLSTLLIRLPAMSEAEKGTRWQWWCAAIVPISPPDLLTI